MHNSKIVSIFAVSNKKEIKMMEAMMKENILEKLIIKKLHNSKIVFIFAKNK